MDKRTVEMELLEHKRLLEGLQQQVEGGLRDAPEGFLRVVTNNSGRTQYYVKNKSDEEVHPQGHYLKKENITLANRIAQRDYDESMLAEIKKEIKVIDTYLKKCNPDLLEREYDKLSKSRRMLVKPWIKPLDEYVKEWQKIQYSGKTFNDDNTQAIYTEKGERVRSKSEKIIADKLFMKGIPYRYEYPLKIKGYGEIYPDFLCLNKAKRKEIYWEHMGMMSNSEYCKSAIKKINIYTRNGYKYGEDIIFTYESAEAPLDTYVIDSIIDTYLI